MQFFNAKQQKIIGRELTIFRPYSFFRVVRILQQFIAEENIEDISFAEAGSFISLNNISIVPLEEIEICQKSPLSDPSEPDNQRCSFTVSADIHKQPIPVLQDITPTCSFDDAFARHLQFPEPPAPKEKKKGPKLPSAISSSSWRKYYEKKDEEKENLAKEKNQRQLLRAEVKERKANEKTSKIPRKKKAVKKSTSKKSALQCSQCYEDLISDVEDELEINIGCDKCVRWYHLKCTIFKDLAYVEAASNDYTCPFCDNTK